MSLYQREGSPFWWYDFTVNGLRFRGSTGKEAKREARKVEDDHKQQARKGQKRPDEWKLHDLCRAYYDEHAQHRRSSATILHQLAKLREHIGKDRKLSSITNATMMDYRQARKGEGLEQSSINREIVILRAAMRYANDIHGVAIPKLAWPKLMAAEMPGRVRFLSFDEYAVLLDKAHADLRPIIICAVTTGLRKNNILAMDWSQVKLGQRIIQAVVKGNKEHSVRIVPQLMAILSTTPLDGRKGRVFRCINFEKRWRAALADAKIADFRFHDLRHTFASWARQNGADIADLKEGLGHSDISMSMRYAHIKPDSKDTAFDRVSDAISAHSTAHKLKKA
jgi:integrase